MCLCMQFDQDVIGTTGSIVVCVSPLVSLMIDQQSRFSLKGLITEFVCEDCDQDSIKRAINGDLQLLYISPESMICNRVYRNMILSQTYQDKLVAFVVDKAHCVKMWYVTIINVHSCNKIYYPFLGEMLLGLHMLSWGKSGVYCQLIFILWH